MSESERGDLELDEIEQHAGRRDRLISAVGKIRTKDRVSADRAFQVAAWVLIPLGVIFIVLAWYGASNTTRVWQQIPYMISGGLLGLGLIFAGGFGYFAAWLTRMLDENRRDSAEAREIAQQTLAALGRIEAALSPNGRRAGADRTLVVRAKGNRVHRADCPLVEGKTDVRKVTSTRGLRACQICRPAMPATSAQTRRARG